MVRPRKHESVDGADLLETRALEYLDRFDATAAKLRGVLMRQVRRSANDHGTDPAAGARMVDALIERYRGSKIIDDVRYARGMARSLHERGASLKQIRHKLAARGIEPATMDAVLREEALDGAESDLRAAERLVLRRRLGRHRDAEARRERFQRDLAVLARAGFDLDVARRALAADPD